MSHILLVEDDTHIKDFIVKGLQEFGHTVEFCNNTDEADAFMCSVNINLAIIDIMLKDKRTGLELVAYWRSKQINQPVIFLSARDRTEDKVAGFNVGGDDYLTKPFSLLELKARIDNLLRRAEKLPKKNEFEYHGLVLNLLTRRVERGGKDIFLQRREFVLLEYFMENPEQVLGKMMILERVWGFNFDPQTNVVDVLISRIRAKIDKGFSNQLIHTVRGMGYVLRKD